MRGNGRALSEQAVVPKQQRTATAPARTESAQYLYICGSGHSGSTLLEMMLAGHPDMTAVGEIQNFAHQLAIGRVCSCGALPRDCSFWQAVAARVKEQSGVDFLRDPQRMRTSRARPAGTADRLVRAWSRAATYAAFRLRGPAPLTRAPVPGNRRLDRNHRAVINAVREVSGAKLIVDSSKDYVRMREAYAIEGPGRTKVLYLHRDGRGPVWSAIKLGRPNVAALSADWARNQVRTRRMLETIQRSDWMPVRYEELCAEPGAVLRRICDFVGLEFHPAMLDLAPPEHHTIAGNKIRVERRMEIRVDESWRQGLSPADQQTFQRIAGPENHRLGYA